MTKKLLLSLGATTALVGTSFAIVSCANTKTEAKIKYDKDAFEASKGFFELEQQSEYITEITKPQNKWLLDATFTPDKEGAIAKIDAVFSYDSGINVRFTLKPAKGFTLNKTTFDINYNSGSIVNKTEAKITYNQDAFIYSKKSMNQETYIEYITKPENQETLNSIFTSDIKGAISYISVRGSWESDKNVRFTLKPADGFILDKTEFVIDYDNGLQEATIKYDRYAFRDSKKDMSQSEYIEAMNDPNNKDLLDAIFESNIKGAISEIKVEDSDSGKNVKFTLTAKDGFTLNQTEFVIVYADGTLVDDSTPNEPQEKRIKFTLLNK